MHWFERQLGEWLCCAPRTQRSRRPATFESLEARLALVGDLSITEFMAGNSDTLDDQDGEASDWVEIHNASQAAVDLNGWHLTDDADDLAKWSFPSVSIPAGGYLVVFASGKDRAVSGSELHTNFRLEAAGEYLALIQPDGVTIASEFEPEYPPQASDVSYGLVQTAAASISMIGPDAEARVLVPSAVNGGDALGEAWKAADFDDAAWNTGTTGIGFERAAGYENLIRLDVGDAMFRVNQSVFVRLPFQFADVSRLLSLTLRMKYDDGFVAYLNGALVARRNAPESLSWDSGATALHPDLDAMSFEQIDITPFLGDLREGENVLAIHGLNAGVASNDFLIVPELSGVERSSSSEAFFRYLTSATPGATNVSEAYEVLTSQPTFSATSGIYDNPIEVTVTSTTPGATLAYTLDGTLPSTTNGRQVDPADGASLAEISFPVDMTGTIRVAAFKAGALPAPAVSASYVILSYVAQQPANPPGLPSTWAGGFPADYGMDPDVIDTTLPGYDLRTALLSLPSLVVTARNDDLFSATSGIYANSDARGQERHASVELINPDGSDGFQIDAGLQMHGNSSRNHGFTPKHPIRVLFKSQYGASKLRKQVFPDSPVDRFDELLLRAASTDSWPVVDGDSVLGVQRWARIRATYIRDQYMRDTQLAMGQASGHGIYVHLYLNGLYWGLYNLAERPGDSFNAETFGGEKEEYDVIKDFAELESGNRAAWDQMISLAGAGLGSEAAYQLIQGNLPDGTKHPTAQRLLDVENLIDYMILHIYSGAEDWPHHNWWAARRRGPESDGFQFFSWDQEISNDSLIRTHTLFQTRFEDPVDSPSPSYLYGRLMANATFRQKFADRVQELCFNGGVLTPEANYARWLNRQQEIDRAMVAESARWGDSKRSVPYKREVEWLNEMNWMRDVYWPQIQSIALDRFRRVGLFPAVLAPGVYVNGEPKTRGRVEEHALLELRDPNNPAGVVFYTLDGVDPRMAETALQTYTMVTAASPTNYRVPSDGADDDAWFDTDFNDRLWSVGTAAIGYERASGYESIIATDVGGAMYNVRQTVYMRIPFELATVPLFDTLTLRMKYDDGYVVYLNGEPIASRNAPADVAWDSGATTQHADAQAIVFEDVDVTSFAHLLRAGQNVLAIHGLNGGAGSSDFLIVPELVAIDTSGDLSPSALIYTGALTLQQDVRIRTRVKRGGEWSGLIDAEFTMPSALRISELMFHPPDPPPGSPFEAEEFEFIELLNTGGQALALQGHRFTEGVEFAFENLDETLVPGERALLVTNRGAFESRYGTGWRILGEYSGRLSNSGERLRLVDAMDESVLDFIFDDAWELGADGNGSSLVIVDPDQPAESWGSASSWSTSRLTLGSPGLPETRMAGDANGDGLVDLTDLNLVRNHFGGLGWGDVDDDRDIDLEDLNQVRNHFGESTAAGFMRSTSTPPDAVDPGVSDRAVRKRSVNGRDDVVLNILTLLDNDLANPRFARVARQRRTTLMDYETYWRMTFWD